MKQFKGELLCLLAATIFGAALLFQRTGGEALPPFYLTSIRFFLGSLCILPFILKKIKIITKDKKLILYGFLCGLCLFVATASQQIAIVDTPVGKAGFVASLYIFFIPIESFIIFNRKIAPKTAVAIIVAIIGSFLLYDIEGFSISRNDIFLILSSVFYALQIVLAEKYLINKDPLLISFIQYLSCAILSFIVATSSETLTISMLKDGFIPLFYLGIISCGIGYTSQMIGQKYVNSSIAGLILSLESVISLLLGYFVFNEILNTKEMIGCILMLTGILISEIPDNNKKGKN